MTDEQETETLTVAVATCGRPSALATCLAALARQTRLPDEVIVVDQDPRPETRDVVAACGLPVVYVEQERRGLSASRNLALALAGSAILAVTDDDCYPDDDWCHAILCAFASPQAPDGVTGPVLPPDGIPPADMCALSMRPSRETVVYAQRIAPWVVGSGANFACRRGILAAIGGWNERLGVGTPGRAGEDCEINYRLLVAGNRIRYDGNVVIHHAWQTRERRRETRWTYGYGIGALCGTVFGRADHYAFRMLGSYGKQHLLGIGDALKSGDGKAVQERVVALAALLPGFVYGFRAERAEPRKPIHGA